MHTCTQKHSPNGVNSTNFQKQRLPVAKTVLFLILYNLLKKTKKTTFWQLQSYQSVNLLFIKLVNLILKNCQNLTLTKMNISELHS